VFGLSITGDVIVARWVHFACSQKVMHILSSKKLLLIERYSSFSC